MLSLGLIEQKAKYISIYLKLLDYTVVQKICSTLPFQNRTECDNFAAHLLFYSGGHPGCMSQILGVVKKYYSKKVPSSFFSKHWKVIEA
jgi:hypothetical protein